MQLTFKNANRILFGNAIILNIVWFFLEYTTFMWWILIGNIIGFISLSFYKEKPEKPAKYEVIIIYLIGIFMLIAYLLFNLLALLFFSLVGWIGGIAYHISFIALKKQGARESIKLPN